MSTPMGRKAKHEIRFHGGPLIRVKRADLEAAGVELVLERTVGVEDGKPVLADGRVLDVANVIWCTGFRNDYGWIRFPLPTEEDRYPEQQRGAVPSLPGLYFVGLPFLHSFARCSSSALGETERAWRSTSPRVLRRRRPSPSSFGTARTTTVREIRRGCDVAKQRTEVSLRRSAGTVARCASADPPGGRQKRPSRSERARRRPAHAVKQAERRIAVSLPSRRVEPERVVAHLGPTNSGKTHAALEELAAKRSGVYAGPLRMLAQEAHRRLGAWIGEENVGLVTGEERVNEHAP